MVPSQQQVRAAEDPHQTSRFHVAAGELGEMQPPERCSGGLSDHFSCQPAFLVIQVGSSCGGSALIEHEPVHIVGDVRTKPIVRLNSPYRFFWWAKTCSTRARMLDFLPLAHDVATDIGLPLGLRRWIWLRSTLDDNHASFALER